MSNIVGALLGKIVLLKGEKYVHSRPLLHELFLLNRVFTHRSLDVQASLFGFGGGVGQSAPGECAGTDRGAVVVLPARSCCGGENTWVQGIFLHFDNMELASLRNPEETRQLFERLRDVLQIQDMYYIFVAQRGFFLMLVRLCSMTIR